MTETFLTEAEVVARYRKALTAGTLRNWRSKGWGPPFVRIGKSVLYALADLQAWEDRQRVAPLGQRAPAPWEDMIPISEWIDNMEEGDVVEETDPWE